MQLAINSQSPISLAKEMAAYEALWDEQGASFKSIAEKFRASENASPSALVDPTTLQNYLDSVLKIMDDEKLFGANICLHNTADYPDKLRDAKYPVELFYYKGDLELLNSRCVAIVGTRNPSSEGKQRATKLAKLFVNNNFTIVSGLAKGIDTYAHGAAIKAGGRTVAVIGTPLNEVYPRENALLQDFIASNFLIVSSIPFIRYSKQIYKFNRLFFPERNKVMSALTEATIIVEASDTSGTLVQAQAALEQGRKLFILESCFHNKQISWPNKFLARGAIRIQEFEEFKEHLDF